MDLVHALYEPEGDGPFATLFALHGFGSNGIDLIELAPHLLGGELLVIAPDGPLRVPLGDGAFGKGWFALSAGGGFDERGFEAGREALAEFLEAAGKRYPVDASRQLLLGFSQGGVMAYDAALREPERWAGLAALSSWLPEPLAERYAYRPAHSMLPTLVQHGRDDDRIPLARGEESVRRLQALGVPVTFGEYAMGHAISAESLHDLNRWLRGEVFQPG